jgi:4-hydroxy-tetrahydrodipicolinate synthase
MEMITGYNVAVVTPFRNGKTDCEAFEKYINRMVNSGVSGLAVCGSTGESLSLSLSEKINLIKIASEINGGKIKLIGGVIDAVTDGCAELMRKTEKYVDAFLCICPFYLKPSKRQVYDHFRKLHDETERELILYNNPGRTGTGLDFDTFKRLADLERVVGIKECAADLSVFSVWRSAVKEKFSFLCGNDNTACGALAMGASGVISVTANTASDLCIRMYEAFRRNDGDKFGILRDALAPLHELMFAEPSPAPTKYLLSRMGFMSDELRSPLSPISSELQRKIDEAAERLGIVP